MFTFLRSTQCSSIICQAFTTAIFALRTESLLSAAIILEICNLLCILIIGHDLISGTVLLKAPAKESTTSFPTSRYAGKPTLRISRRTRGPRRKNRRRKRKRRARKPRTLFPLQCPTKPSSPNR